MRLTGRFPNHRGFCLRSVENPFWLPCSLGRSPRDSLILTEPGVWDHHCEIHLRSLTGFSLTVREEALATLNNQPVKQALLHNGDILQMGSARLQFWLAAPRIRRLAFACQEAAIWLLVLLVTAFQGWLMVRLLS